ncbi:hypothetical protein EQV77_09210 [Halobacillus fulvus]|nr:hypothetical protein EQV77_09210 [Halobacillus fulvus]
MSFVEMRAAKVYCSSCGKASRRDLRARSFICWDCQQKAKRTKTGMRLLKITSFLLFPLGILFYFIWKESKPVVAKTALKYALTALVLFILYHLFLDWLAAYLGL